MADARGNSLVFTYTSAFRELLMGILPFNLDQNTALIVAYDYHLSKIEEKDASGALSFSGRRFTCRYHKSGSKNSRSLTKSVKRSHISAPRLRGISAPVCAAPWGAGRSGGQAQMAPDAKRIDTHQANQGSHACGSVCVTVRKQAAPRDTHERPQAGLCLRS